tara:strand:- start:17075 stop:17755 length:681 start_codon:yes stop_codon:yes gene_type:complete
MSKFDYTDEMVARMESAANSGVTEPVIQELCDEFEFPRRSVTAKLRKLGFDVPKKPGAAPVFSPEQTDALSSFLSDNSGTYTAEEIAETFSDGDFTARQINGKALSLEMTQHIKPAEKKVTPKTYTAEEETTIESMVTEGRFLEEIADSVGKTVASVRGKLLSMGLKATQRDKKASKSDPYEGIDGMTDQSVEALAEHFGKTVRGVKTVLTRRGLSCADYTPKSAE